MIRRTFSAVAVLFACLLPAAVLQAEETCDPFAATFRMELWPHAQEELDFYLLAASSGCSANPGPVHCTGHTVLAADAANGTPPDQALSEKCKRIVSAFSSSCPRFLITNVDCDANPGQMTLFDVTDTECSGTALSPGEGMALAAANQASAFSNFVPGGVVPTDYELDSVIPSCIEGSQGLLVLGGDGGSGTPVFPGDAASFEVVLITTKSGMVSHAEPTLGVSPEDMTTTMAHALNQIMVGLGDTAICQGPGRLLLCFDFPAFSPPNLSGFMNDTGMSVATAGGNDPLVIQIGGAVQSGGCSDLENDCPALGTSITLKNLPALGGRGVILLGIALSLSFGWFVRSRHFRAAR